MALRLRNQSNLKIVGILTAALALIAQPFAVLPFAEVFASSTLSLTPSQHTVAGSGDRNVGKRAESTVDAAGYTDLVLTFDHDARELDNNDFLHYGWQAPDGAEAQLGTINGANNSSNNPAPGEVGSKQYNLPAEAAVNGLKIWFENYTNNVTDDSVYLSNIALSGDEAAPVVQPTITSLRYATTTGPKTTYSGIVVDFVVSNFVDATDCVISIHRADGTDATRTCGPNLVNHINSSSSGANKSTTTPFSVLGSAPSSWYAETTGSWSQSTLPVSVTVVINTTSHGDITATNSNPLNQSYVPYADIAPADPEPFKINTPRYNVADGKVFAGGPEAEVKLVWYPPTNSTNNRYEVRWAKSLEELATTDPVNTGQYPYKVIKDIENGQWFWQMRATKSGVYSDWATPRSFTVDIDKVGPTITNVKPVTGTSVKTDFTVSANVSDPNGVKKVALYVFDQATNTKVKEYPLSNTEGDIWTAQVKLADLRGDAIYDLRFRAVDNLDNVTYHNNRGGTYLVNVDRASPALSNIEISPMINGNISGVVTVSFRLTDPSGVDLNRTRVLFADGPNDTNRAKESSAYRPVSIGDGRYQVTINTRDFLKQNREGKYNLTFRLYDTLGNHRSTKPPAFRGVLIDNAGPSMSAKTPAKDEVIQGVYRVSAVVTDPSGVQDDSVYARFRDDNGREYTFYLQREGDSDVFSADVDTTQIGSGITGPNRVSFFARDGFGTSRSSVSEGVVITERIAPVVSLESAVKEDGTVDVVASIADANLSHYWFTVTRDGVDVNLSNTKKRMEAEAFSDKVLATLSQPGEYVVKLEARDKAGNKDGTASKDGDSVKTISFAIEASSDDTGGSDSSQPATDQSGDGDDTSSSIQGPDSSANTNDTYTLGAQINTSNNTILNPAVGTLFGGDVIARAGDSSQQTDSARVLGDQDEQPAVTGADQAESDSANSADEDGCWSLLGLCWYWWLLIVAAVVVLAVLVRKAAATNEAEASDRRL